MLDDMTTINTAKILCAEYFAIFLHISGVTLDVFLHISAVTAKFDY